MAPPPKSHLLERGDGAVGGKRFSPVPPGGAGFTLIELAIVLVIVGLLLGMGASLLGPLIKRSKALRNEELLKKARETVVTFVEEQGRLPTQPEFESLTGGRDVFGKQVLYLHPPELETSCTRPFGLTLRRCGDVACSNSTIVGNVAFVLVSGGLNTNVQTSFNGNTVTVYYPGTVVDGYANDFIRNEEYDDDVEWTTTGELHRFQNCMVLSVKADNLPSATEDEPYERMIEVEGGRPPYSFESTGQGGLTLNPDGSITGTPNLYAGSDGSFINDTPPRTITLESRVTDSVGDSVSFNATIKVYPSKLKIVTPSLPTGNQNESYEARITASGGVQPYSWTGCPSARGLSCRTSGNELVIEGAPEEPGTYSFTATVRDVTGTTASRKFSIVINAVPSSNGTGGGGSGGSGGGSSCTSITVVNTSGGTLYIGKNSTVCAFVCMSCPYGIDRYWFNGRSITLYRGNVIELVRRCTVPGRFCRGCYARSRTVTFDAASAADSNGNCRVAYDGRSYSDL